jgi:hypothetical protein
MDSVRLQGAVVNQVFIVDNNSTDSTSEVVRDYIQEHNLTNWRLLHEPILGAPLARNLPLPLVEGDWIQFLDADDELLEGKLEHQLKLVRTQPCDVVVGASCHESVSGDSTVRLPEAEVRLALISSRCGITSANLFRACMVRTVQGWDESLSSSQEYDLMFRLWQKGAKFAVEATPLTRIHERPSGRITTSNLSKKWTNHCVVQRQMLLGFLDQTHTPIDFNQWLQDHFSCIRILHQYDPEKALEFWRAKEFNGFIPEVNSTNTAAYVMLFRLLGFEGVEGVRKEFRRLTRKDKVKCAV